MPSLTRLTFIAPDGSEVELRDKSSGGQPQTNFYEGDTQNGCFIIEGLNINRGRVFVSSDGSALTFISDSDIHDFEGQYQTSIRPSGYLLMADGTLYRVSSGLVDWIRDRNGNGLAFHYDTFNRVDKITDSLNREITITYAGDICNGQPGTPYDEIKYRGNGGAFHSILVRYDCLGNVIRSDFGGGARTFNQLFPNLNGASNNPFNPR